MLGMRLNMVGVAWIVCAIVAAGGCGRRTPQQLQVLINAQAQKHADYLTSQGATGVFPETYSECREPTPADRPAGRDDGQVYEAICTERHPHFDKLSGPPDHQCYVRVSVRIVGLWDEGQSVMARLSAGGPVIQVAYLTDPDYLRSAAAEWAAARAAGIQPCPPDARQRVQ